MIDRKRLVAPLLELIRIDSPSRKERQVALRVKRELESLGAEVEIDNAGQKVGGNTGNLIGRIRASLPGAPSILLAAHMDTVQPGEGIEPTIEGDIIKSDGKTILGADDKSGISLICEVARILVEGNLPHGDLEMVFTICEEIGPLGVKHLDFSKLRSRFGIVLDNEELSELAIKAPAADSMEFRVHGLEAHAGLRPERGINGIKVAAEAIAEMKLGRIDHETTANIGVIQGGIATNVVPSMVVVQGEARSHAESKLEAQVAHMRRCFQETALKHHLTLDGQVHRAWVEEKILRDFPAMNVPEDSPIVQLVLKSAKKLGMQIQPSVSGGGFDANTLNANGITAVGLGTGMREAHTTREYLKIDEMLAAGKLLLEVLQQKAARE